MAEINDFSTVNLTNNPRWTEGVQLIPQINDSAREVEAIVARNYRDNRGTLNMTGGPTTYALTTGQSVTTLFEGFRVSAKCSQTCAINPTLNVNGTGARNLVVQNGSRLREDDMIGGAVYDMVFLANQWHVINPTENRRRGRMRLDPGDASTLRFEGFSQATSNDFFVIRGFGRNTDDDTVEYGEYRIGVRTATAGQEEGRLIGSVIQDGVKKTTLQIEGDRAALFGAAVRSPNSLALPAGGRIFAGTLDLLASTGARQVRIFRSDGTFIKSSTSNSVLVFVIGGGGGGGRGANSSTTGGGGGSGGVAVSAIPSADLPASSAVSVNSGGAGGSSAGNGGNNGGTASFLGITAGGGFGGAAGGSGGNGGVSSDGQGDVTGAAGTTGGNTTNTNNVRTPGGAGPLLGIGRGGEGANSGTNASGGQDGGVVIIEF